MLEPDAEWPMGPHDVERPTPWPPAELPPEWPAGADPERVYNAATWGDAHCQWLIERCREVNAGIARDGQHRDLAAFAGGGD